MASRKGGKVEVGFFDTASGFKVTGKGAETTFATLDEFRAFAEKNEWSGEAVARVEQAVFSHYVELDAAAPLAQAVPETLAAGKKGAEVAYNPAVKRYQVDLPYHPDIVALMRKVPGAVFDKEQTKAWLVPVESRGELAKAISGADGVVVGVDASRKEIDGLARAAIAGGKTKAAADVAVRVSGFHLPNWVYTGPVIAANRDFVAQLVDGDKEEAQVVVHASSSLPKQVFAGDDVGISYDEKGAAKVMSANEARSQIAVAAVAKLEESMGRMVDGVKVERTGEGVLVSLDGYHPRAAAELYRLQKYDAGGVKFDRDLKGYPIPDDLLGQPGAMEDFARAVLGARREIREEASAIKEIEQIAQDKLTGAKVQYPGKDGEFQTGPVLAVTERFVLQSAGREFMKAHQVSRLDNVPSVGDMVTIRYQAQGKAQVSERAQGQSKSRSL